MSSKRWWAHECEAATFHVVVYLDARCAHATYDKYARICRLYIEKQLKSGIQVMNFFLIIFSRKHSKRWQSSVRDARWTHAYAHKIQLFQIQ